MKYHEEISIGKVEGEEGVYALFHQTFGSGFPFDPGKVFADISYGFLGGYLSGASLGKSKDEFFLYNGVSPVARNGMFPNLEFESFGKEELEKLLEYSGLEKKFSSEDFKGI